ncbi:hypothetical protein CAPTEDRAFT_213683 [Capitella teleta]|uniref:Uncharacterized protein n=1 Tax=Capitella teleta TaxID=283909 RepID=R7V8S5_CAPTE|nr:hypothetical protein CAPTEDRAFT_213683 [Capitella teleta]|eukprot:ELU14917.1 hypothetical protein CAPTEDRAFT_213683 [Capitella teleta]
MTDGVVRLLRVIAGFSVSISSVIRIPSPTVHRATHRKITQLQTKKKHYPSSLRQLHNMLGKRVGCIEQLVNAPDMSWRKYNHWSLNKKLQLAEMDSHQRVFPRDGK